MGKLHQDFFSRCYSRLELILSSGRADAAVVNANEGGNKSTEDALHDGFEVETSLNESNGIAKVLTEINIAEVLTMPPTAK